MKSVVLLEPRSLLGREISSRYDDQRFPKAVPMTLDSDGVGALIDVRGAPAMVADATQAELDDTSAVVVCDGSLPEAIVSAFRARLATEVPVLFGDSEDPPNDAQLWIAGQPAATEGSPRPPAARSSYSTGDAPAILLARLVVALAELELLTVSGALLLPVSRHGQDGIDALFDETRAMLSFETVEKPRFGHRTAFNLSQSELSPGRGDELADAMRSFAGNPQLSLSIQHLNAGVFHSLCASIHVTCRDPDGARRATELLASSPAIELAQPGEGLDAMTIAGSEHVHVEAPRVLDRGPGVSHFALWAGMDNLIAAASNTLGVLAEVAPTVESDA